jgi:hypothetical protein
VVPHAIFCLEVPSSSYAFLHRIFVTAITTIMTPSEACSPTMLVAGKKVVDIPVRL